MGLLDSVLGAAMGSGQQQGNAMQLVMQLVEQSGGVGALVEKLQKGGLGEILQSWLGSGSNLPVSAEQIQSALGSDLIGQAAAKAGVDQGQAGNLLAQYLPQVIDQVSGNGNIDLQNLDLGQIGGSLLKNLFK
ncbi:uncharacterized protein YidB (DUF937 family) [Neisseria sp. HSC-16F19]|nr:YidB family protein [Neisseria sp. HSC-16F19]MCP2041689.1 uncharacterized protein YidB (DUF937 family) [Neisseria sp. HSC-16F19]